MEAGLTYHEYPFLKTLGIQEVNPSCYRNGEWISGTHEFTSISPHNNKGIAKVMLCDVEQYEEAIKAMETEKEAWFLTPAPKRGEIVRQIGEEFRKYKDALGSLVSLETGKIKAEGDGEVQEAIDICDLACGYSRCISGKVIPSERSGHFMMEVWNPYGIVGVISAFNFPCAVHSWNAAIALICGDLVIWKGAPSTPLTTIACQRIYANVLERHGFKSVTTVCQGIAHEVGVRMTQDKRIPVISFTGSTHVGRMVAETV